MAAHEPVAMRSVHHVATSASLKVSTETTCICAAQGSISRALRVRGVCS